MASRHGERRPAGFPVSRPLTLAKPTRKTPPASTTCAAYPTKPGGWPGPASRRRRQVTIERNGSGLRGQPKSARLSPPTGGRRPSDRRSDLHGRSRRPASRPADQPADPESSTYLPFSSHGPSSVRAARDRARYRSCRGPPTRHDPPSPPPVRPGSPSSSAPPSPSVQSSLPFPPHDRPEGRRRPLTTHRNGSAHPPLPKSACLSASCRANAPARPDRRVRPCSLGSTSFPAPARPVPAGLRPPHPLSIWPARLAGPRTPGGQDDPPGPPDPKPPPPGNDSVPTARTRSPIRHRADRTAGPTTRPMTGRPMERCRSVRSIPAGRSDQARPSPGPDRRRPGDPTGWPADRAGGGGSPASTTGHRRRSDGSGGPPRLAFQPAGGRSVQIRTGPRRGGRRRCDRTTRARGAAGGAFVPVRPFGLAFRSPSPPSPSHGLPRPSPRHATSHPFGGDGSDMPRPGRPGPHPTQPRSPTRSVLSARSTHRSNRTPIRPLDPDSLRPHSHCPQRRRHGTLRSRRLAAPLRTPRVQPGQRDGPSGGRRDLPESARAHRRQPGAVGQLRVDHGRGWVLPCPLRPSPAAAPASARPARRDRTSGGGNHVFQRRVGTRRVARPGPDFRGDLSRGGDAPSTSGRSPAAGAGSGRPGGNRGAKRRVGAIRTAGWPRPRTRVGRAAGVRSGGSGRGSYAIPRRTELRRFGGSTFRYAF